MAGEKSFKVSSSETRLTFIIRCKTEFGQRLRIVGNDPALGGWDPVRGVELTTSQGDYPKWRISLTVPANRQLEYKYCIVDPPAVAGMPAANSATASEAAATVGTSSAASSCTDVRGIGGDGPMPRVPSAPGAMAAGRSSSVGMPPSDSRERGSTGALSVPTGAMDPHRPSSAAMSPALSHRTNPPSPVFAAGSGGSGAPGAAVEGVPVPLGPPLLSPPLAALASVGTSESGLLPIADNSTWGEPQWELFEEHRVVETQPGAEIKIDDGLFGVNNQNDEERVRCVRTGLSRTSRENLGFDSSSNIVSPISGGGAGSTDARAPHGLIIVLYRLPIVARKSRDGTWSFEWDDDALYLTSTGLRTGLQSLSVKALWIGILPTDIEVTNRDEQDQISEQLLNEFNCVPVFLPQSTLSKFYQGFCKGTLWPAFHMVTNILGPNGTPRFDEDNWHTYQRVNRTFSKAVVAHYDRQLIWVHDYHLMLLPYYLRIKVSGVKIGFYLHIPWPSSEIFRMLPVRNELIKGVLSSTMLGFHLFDYARHFLSACVRLLNLEHEARRGSLGIDFEGRHVTIRVSHIGVDTDRFVQRLKTPNWKAKARELESKYPADVTLLGAIDDLDVIKGISLKLVAFEDYLASAPDYMRAKVALVQVVIPKAARVDNVVREEIRGLVSHINSKYGTETHQPVHYIEDHISFDERISLYTCCHALMLTPIRDGLNLIPYEYIVSTPEGKGQLILSEFTGCSRALSSAVRVNPWNVKELRDVIDNVVQKREARADEIARKHEADRKYLSHHSSLTWAESFLTDLTEASEASREVVRLGLSVGVGFRTLEFEEFTMLSSRNVVKAFRESTNRLFLLDYDGTLTTIGSDVQTRMAHSWAVPAQEVMNGLVRLSQQEKCSVVIVSGRKLDSAGFQDELVKPLGIAAEHGYYYKQAGSMEWETLQPEADLSWIDIAQRIMAMYTERTDGSYIEAKDAGLVWHYRETDPEFGGWQAKEMHDHLETILSPFNVQVLGGHGWLQVRLNNVNKGQMVQHVLESMGAEKPDFVLCCGDDRTDEDMFDTLMKHPKTKDAALFTTTVGVKPSNARYYLRSAYEVQQLIDQLLEASSSHVRSSTLEDLRPESLQRMTLQDQVKLSSSGLGGGLAGLANSASSSALNPAEDL